MYRRRPRKKAEINGKGCENMLFHAKGVSEGIAIGKLYHYKREIVIVFDAAGELSE